MSSGSAALDLRYVGAGRLDGFWESDLKPWDVAGGALIVSEAGGHVTDLTGNPFNSRASSVLAANDRLHPRCCRCFGSFIRLVIDSGL